MNHLNTDLDNIKFILDKTQKERDKAIEDLKKANLKLENQ